MLLSPASDLKIETFMKSRLAFGIALAISFDTLLINPQADAATYYWDSNDTTSTLGDVGSSVWGYGANLANLTLSPSGIWDGTATVSTIVTGIDTTSSDSIYFGTNSLSLGPIASEIGIAEGGVSIGTIVFGKAQSDPITLSGSGGTITASTIIVNNSSDTIDAVLDGSLGITKAGPGTLVLTGENTFIGGVTLSSGTLQIGNGNSGSLAPKQALNFSSGGGFFNVMGAAGGSTQVMGAPNFNAGDATIQSTYGGSGTTTLSFDTLAVPSAGATGNFVTSGGVNGLTNLITFNGLGTGSLLDKGYFFNGSSYAAYDVGGFMRAYGIGDTDYASTNTTIVNNYNQNVQLTGNITGQGTAAANTINLGAYSITMSGASSLLQADGLLSSGSSSATIGGGTTPSLQTATATAEMVIRVNGSSDQLTISSAILNNGGSSLTKSGAGTLILSGSNTYTGVTTINSGILAVSDGNAIDNTASVILADAAGAEFRLNSNETINALLGGGFSGGNVNVQSNTLTISNANDLTFGGLFTGTAAGGVTVSSGALTLSNKNSFAGSINLQGTSQLTLAYGNDGTDNFALLSSGGAISMAGGTTLMVDPTAQVAGGAAGGAQGGEGVIVSNAINVSSGTATIKHGAGGDAKYVFSGNVTGGTSGNQTLSIIQGANGGNAERTNLLFSGIMQNGAGGTLGVSADFTAASSTNQGAVVNLSGQNTFTGGINVNNTKGLLYSGASTYQGGWLTIGGESSYSGSTRIATEGKGYLGGGNYTGAISLASGTVLDYLSSADQILGGVISGGGGNLVKEGSGTLTLSGTNNYTGTTTITSGVLRITGNSSGANGAVTVTGGALGGNGGSLGGAVTISGTGGTDLRDGSVGNLTLGSSLAITGAAGANSMIFDLGNATNTTDKILVTGATSVTTAGSAVITLNQLGGAAGRNAANTYTLIQGTGAMAAVGQFALATTKAFGQTFGLVVSGNNLNVVTTQVTGAVLANTTLSGSTPSWQDSTKFSGAAVPDYQSNVIINSAIGASVLNGSTDINSLTFGASATTAVSITPGTASVGTNASMLVIEARNANGNTAGNGITLSNTSGSHTISANVGLAASQTWTLASGSSLTASGVVSDFGGGYSLTKAGGGTLTLSGANTYSGGTMISAGILKIGNATAFGRNTAAVSVTAGASLDLNGTTMTGTNALTLNGTGISNGGALTNTSATGATYAGLLTLGSSSSIIATSGNITLSNLGTITGAGNNLTVGGAFNTSIAGIIGTTSGALIKQDAGALTLSGASTYTGSTTINGGLLQIGNGLKTGRLTSTSSIVINSGGNLTINRSGIFNQNGDLGANVAITGLGSFTQAGTGTIILSAVNTYSGATSINSGTLSLTGTIGSGTGTNITVNGSSLLSETSTGVISGASSLTHNSSATSILSGTNTYTGVTTISAGTLQFAKQVSLYNNAAAGAWSAANIKVASGATFAINVGGAGEFTTGNVTTLLSNLGGINGTSTTGFAAGSTIAFDTTNAIGESFTVADSLANSSGFGGGAIGLLKLGTYTLALTNANTYNGATTIKAGVLQLGNGGSTGALSIDSQITNNAILTINRSNAVTQGTDFSNRAIIGSGAFIQAGTGNTTLNAANTFTGSTTVSAGTLTLAHSLALQNSALVTSGAGNLTLNGITTFTLGGLKGSGNLATIFDASYSNAVNLTLNPSSNVTYTGAIANGAAGMTLTKTGAGTQVLAGANTYTGTTIIYNGTLQIGNSFTGSLNGTTGTALIMNGGTFNLQEAPSAIQGMGALTIGIGDNTILSTAYDTFESQTLSFASLNARTVGATANFNIANNLTVTTNKIVFASTTNTPLNNSGSNNQGIFFAGNDYARYDTTAGYLRAVSYGTDTNAFAINGGGNTLGVNDATKDLRISGDITSQGSAALNTLNLTNRNLTLSNSSQVLSANGILATGGSIATAGFLQSATAGGELVIRVNSNTLTVNPIIRDNTSTSSLTKSGAGTLVLSNGPTYTGTTTINAGALQITPGTLNIFGSTAGISLGKGASLFLATSGVSGVSAGTSGAGGYTIANSITLTGSGSSILASHNGAKWNFSGNISSAVGGDVTLNIRNNQGGTGGDRTDMLFSGVISNGSSSALGLSFALSPQSGSATNDHPAYANLTALNTFTGNITLTRPNAGSTSWLVIGGERWSDGAGNAPSYGRQGSGRLADDLGGVYAGNFNLSSTPANVVNLDYFSSANQTWSGVIGGGVNNVGSLIKEGSGTLTLTNANTYNGLTTVGGGTLLLGYTSTTTNILSSATRLWMGLGTTYQPGSVALTIAGGGGGGTLQLGGSAGSATQTLASLNTAANTANRIVMGANRLLTFTSPTITIGSNSGLNFNTAAGGNNGATVGTSVVAFGGVPTTFTNGFTVTDAGGFGLATINGSNQVIRNTSTLALPGSGGSSPTNYLTTSSTGNSVTSSQSAGSITTDTTGGNVTLTLGGGVTLSNNVWNFGGIGSNTAQVTGGNGVNSVASANTIIINNFNTGTVTFNSPILANGSNAVIMGGTGTVALAGVNTFTGGTNINSGILQIIGSGSLQSGSYAGTIDINGGAILQYRSSAAQTLSGAIRGAGGLTKDTNASTLILSGTNTYTGITTINAGTLQVGNGATAGAIFGTGTVINNATLNFNRSDSYGGSFTPIISGSGALNLMGGTLTLSGANTYTGATSINAGTLAINSTNSLGDGSATNTLIFNGGTLQAAGAIMSQSTRSVTMTSTGTIDSNSQSVSIAGNIGSTGGLNKNGAGTLTLSGTNTYGGVTTVNAGTLQFAKQLSLYNNNTASWTSTNINVKSGSTLALNVGSSGEFTTGNLTTLLTNLASSSSSTNGMLAGSNFGFDTTNASGGIFTISDVIADSIGASGGARGVTKLGTANLVLSNSNSYTGVTTINSGTLSVSSLTDGGYNSNIGSSLNAAGNLVLNGGTLQYTGAAQSTDRLFSLQSSSTLDSSGSGAINFTNTGSMGFNSGTSAKTLTLTGSNTGSNTIAAVIGDNTGATSVAKSGVGNWVMSGVNTYTGGTTVSGGTLTLANALALQNSALTISGGTVALSGLTSLTVGGLNGSINLSSITNYGSLTALKLNPQTAITAVYTGIVSNGSGAMTLTKTGAGMQVLAGAHTYTGLTTVNQGTLQIGNSASGSLTTGNALTFTGTGIFNVVEAANVSQTMGALTFSAGDGTVSSTWNPGSGNTALTFASLTRAAGATGNFTLAGSLTTNNRIALTSSAGAPLTTGSNNQGIFFGGNNYARYNTSTNTFAAVIYSPTASFNSNATTVGGVTTIGATTASLDILLSGAITGQTAATVNTIKTGFAIAQTGGSTLSVNGILTTAGVAVGTVGNSLNTTSAGGEMVINATTGTTTVAANIIDNGTSRLTKTGAGTLTLSGTNTYAGGTFINVGTLQVLGASGLGSGSASVIAGAQLFINANSLTIANSITLNGTTTNGAIYSGPLAASNVTNLSGQITLNATSNISHWWNDKTLLLSGKITGSGGLNMDLQSGSVGGRYYITGATNDYTGATSVTGSATSLSGYTGQAMLYLGATNALTTTTALTLNYADLYLNGQSQTLASISGSGTFSVQNGSNIAASLTLGAGNTTSTFSGSLKDNGISVTNTLASPTSVPGTVSLTKIGTGTLTLTAANTHTGLTTISQGILQITNASALGTTAGATTIATGATLDLFGQTIAENISSIDGVGVGGNGAMINSNTNTASVITGTIAAGTFTVGGSGNITLPTLGGSSVLTKTGSGSVTLGGSTNNSSLTTTVNNGKLILGKTSTSTVHSIGAASTVNSSGTIQLGGSGNYQIDGGIDLTVNNGGVLDMNGQNQDYNQASAIGKINLNGTGISSGGALINSASATTSTVTFGTGGIVMQSNSSIGGAGNLNVSGVISGSGIALTKTGSGTLTLTGTNTYTGTTTVASGSLVINGAIASTSVVVNGSLSGSGTMANATISGSGSINPGNSPGILTASATNPTSGLDYNFEFTTANTLPTWNNPTASVNDVLRLTDLINPITATMTSTNLVSLYLNVASIASGNIFTGGFYTDKTASFLSAIAGANFQYYLANVGGSVSFNGVNYNLYSGPLGFKVNTVQQTADFGSGNVSGHTTQFTALDHLQLYSQWAGGGGVFANDDNSDGIPNGLAWLLGVANPSTNARPYLPVPAVSSGNITLTFNALNKASRGAASIKVQYSKDLGITDAWHDAEVPDATSTVGGIDFTITPLGGGYIYVQAFIPAINAAPGTKLFTRVGATLP